jgi:hypothetical protein
MALAGRRFDDARNSGFDRIDETAAKAVVLRFVILRSSTELRDCFWVELDPHRAMACLT